MLGYLASPRVGAVVYNVGHTYLAPLTLGGLAFASGASVLLLGALIWAAHIGFDRMLGYGLKAPAGFQMTHLSPAEPPAKAAVRR